MPSVGFTQTPLWLYWNSAQCQLHQRRPPRTMSASRVQRPTPQQTQPAGRSLLLAAPPRYRTAERCVVAGFAVAAACFCLSWDAFMA